MLHALRLGARNLGQTWPNPAVGAIVVKDNRILGTGWTARGGRPHAEPQALMQAGVDAKGATLYVTLEPCNHTGQTPPCTNVIIQAGITRVVAACSDPDVRVSGKGFARLREAGIEVITGLAEAEARRANEGFFSRIERGRPFVTVKLATTGSNQFNAPGTRWLTGEHARDHGHALRSQHDAILTGSGTYLSDTPLLTCRLPGLQDRSPQRVLLDRRGRVKNPWQDAWVLNEATLGQALQTLSQRGITRLMVEAGPALTSAFLTENLADRVFWYRSPLQNGSGPAISPLAGYGLSAVHSLSPDTLEIYEKS